jgi:hypothetical protein
MADTFKEKFDSIKGTSKGILISFLLIIVINTLILWAPLGECLIIFLIPVATFGIQYIFGERTMKRFILIGLVVLLLTGLLLGAVYSVQIAGYADHPNFEGQAPDGTLILTNGQVEPKGVSETQPYNFTVTYIDPGGLPTSITVNIYSPALDLNVTHPMLPADSSNDTATGKSYFYSTTLDQSLYFFSFSTINSTGVATTASGTFGDYELGPVNLPFHEFLILGLTYVPFLAMIYLLFIMLYWWTKKAKTYQPPRPRPDDSKDDDEEFTCSKCGADVPGSAAKCPSCGEEFEEDEEEEKEKEKGKEKEEEKAGDESRICRVCNYTIKKGDMILGCQCGRAYHLRCAQRVGKCPSCGTDFKA